MSLGAQLRVSRFWLQARSRDALDLPPFSGSLLRGVFGAALRDLSCLTGAPVCTGCTLRASCPYALLMETPAPAQTPLLPPGASAPHPWVLEPPAGPARLPAGATFSFSLVLLGRAHAHLGLCLLAFRRAFAQGLGPRRVSLDLVGIRREAESEWIPVEHFEAGSASPLAVPPAPQSLTIHLETILRIVRRGEALGPEGLGFPDFFSTLQRRLGLLEALHEDACAPDWDYRSALEAAHSCSWSGEDLRWVEWERYSRRQDRRMAWSGIQGRFHLPELPERLWPVLYRGQWTHAGKNATFGLGRYRLTSGKFAEPDKRN